MTTASPSLQAFIPKAADLMVVAPEIIVIAAACLILLAELLPSRVSKLLAPWIAATGLVGAFIPIVINGVAVRHAFSDMMVTDGFATLIKAVLAITGLLTIGISANYIKREELDQPEYYALILFSISGMMMMASSADLIMVFLSLEILSISLYILSGFARTQPKSDEAALKYFLLGSFASAFFLYGVALIYGAAQSTNLAKVAEAITAGGMAGNPLLLIGAGLLTVGLGFKVAAAPFHMWTPDVYEGAPSSVTAFMSVGAKVAGFAALARVVMTAFGAEDLNAALWVIAALTMLVGNVVAIAQTNIKRMLAYSSIAHAGYILVGIVAANKTGISAIVFYLLVYAFMNLGAWAVVILIGGKGDKSINLSDYAGLFWRRPGLAAAMGVFMFALAGLPPTGGFMAKFYIFSAALQANLVGLTVIGVLTSLISVYFYLRITVLMFMREPMEAGEPIPIPFLLGAVLVVTTIITLILGVFPNELFKLAGLARIAGL
ncbi:MAG: NADH-quinone oxidoreductase subunit N [Armatimonadota bacterium]|nr:NADH-quinone oxidoreductase subunit N [Armatimonadota bacterium]